MNNNIEIISVLNEINKNIINVHNELLILNKTKKQPNIFDIFGQMQNKNASKSDSDNEDEKDEDEEDDDDDDDDDDDEEDEDDVEEMKDKKTKKEAVINPKSEEDKDLYKDADGKGAKVVKEENFHEGKMSQIYAMDQDGASATEIAKALKVSTNFNLLISSIDFGF